MVPAAMRIYGQFCGWTLARAHARSGDSVAIAAYLGTSSAFDKAIVDFSESYADRNLEDHTAFLAAIESGRLEAVQGI
jgi:thiamine monophosphate kinase